ncbi:MAG: hypothetical protein LBD12_04760 [Clostridiales Family XIII bacterium]|jgi:hypothetical protein|nr:hypothetical protein [Clostridiales Family XIII bacterium]
MEAYDTGFGALVSLVRAVPPHRVRNTLIAVVWSVVGILTFVFRDAIMANVSVVDSAGELYFYIVPGIFVVYGRGLLIYTFTRHIAVFGIYRSGIVVKAAKKEQRIALRDVYYYVMNSQGLLIRDKNGESLGEIRYEVFGDRVYIAYVFLKENVQPDR